MKMIAYILAFNLLFANSFSEKYLSELVKVFALLDHWHHHQTENEVRFLDYLTLHYTDQQHHDQDHKHHEDLPFHSHQPSQNTHNCYVLPSFKVQLKCKILLLEIDKHFFSYQKQFSNLFITEIWQPPKF
jgi:hypothetical protein